MPPTLPWIWTFGGGPSITGRRRRSSRLFLLWTLLGGSLLGLSQISSVAAVVGAAAFGMPPLSKVTFLAPYRTCALGRRPKLVRGRRLSASSRIPDTNRRHSTCLSVRTSASGWSFNNHRRPPNPSALCLSTTTSGSNSKDDKEASFAVPMTPPPSASTDASDLSDYEFWVRRLYTTNVFHPAKLGLETMRALAQALGIDNPPNVLHIAGTNGKGSVAYKLASTLQAAGYRTGLFVSPHVSSFRERVQINRQPLSEADVVELLPQIYQACQDHDLPATFFEITTALALLHFVRHECDYIVLETGLGGRLDATNIVPKPLVTIVTSIGLEHTRILGDTIELIGREKAGIFKADVPVVVGPSVPHDVMRECATKVGSSAYYISDDLVPSSEVEEDYDDINGRIVRAALQILEIPQVTEDAIAQGLQQRPPCRFEVMTIPPKDTTVVLDVAHNPDALRSLVSKFRQSFGMDRGVRVVAGFSSDKDLVQCGHAIDDMVGGDVSRIYLMQAAHPRAASIEAILEANPSWRSSQSDPSTPSITEQVQRALKDAETAGDVVIICGSVFVMAEARQALGIDEPRDSEALTAVAGAGLRHSQENFGNTTSPESSKG